MFYLIANFKSNLVKKDLVEYIQIINKGLALFTNKCEIKIIFCPSYPYLYLFEELSKKYEYVSIGSQDVSNFPEGSYTGNINAKQLLDTCKYCIIGHSERRLHYSENDDLVYSKLKNLHKNNISPIICVSNIDQLTILSQAKNTNFNVAYEPIEYIGGVTSAPLDTVENFIKKSGLTSIIYGGSINSNNCAEYLTHSSIKGFLVGGACLNALEFLKILQKANTLLRSI